MELTGVLVMLLTFVVLLGIGVPIAFAIGLSTIATILVSVEALPAVTTISQRMATGLDSFTLLAIPLFILAGQLMNQGGMARRLVEFAKSVVGMLPGGLAFVNILACMLFGAIAGSAVAAAAAIGTFMAPMMEKEGYDKNFGAAVNITSSTMGLILPPSNILIVYAVAGGGVSIGALFLAGYIPGILLGVGLMIMAGLYAMRRGYPRGEVVGLRTVFRRFLDSIPSIFLLVIIMGGIVGGIFTATEAAAVAVFYAGVLAFIYREIRVADLPAILLRSGATTAIVMLLIATSIAMSWVLSYENIPQAVSTAMIALSNNPIVILLIINAILLFVGIFMDMTPAVLIFTPIFLPVVIELGIDPVHFGIVMVLNLCAGLCTPPVGTVLFVGVGVANTKIESVIKPLIPLYIVMIICLVIVTFIPELSLWLPRAFGF